MSRAASAAARCAVALSACAFAVLTHASAPVQLWSHVVHVDNSFFPELNEAVGAAVDSAGNVFVSGSQSSISAPPFYCSLVVKVSSSGDELWRRDFCKGALVMSVVAIAVDSAGDLLLAGAATRTSNSPQIEAVKLSGGDGATIWSKGFTNSSGVGANETPVDMRVDASGNAVVVAYSRSTTDFGPTTYASAVLKYRNSDGALLWSNLGKINSTVYAMSIDASGAVLVGGEQQFPTARGSTVLKVTADGQSAWQVQPADPDSGSTIYRPYAMAIDSHGDVYVEMFGGAAPKLVKLRSDSGFVAWHADGLAALSSIAFDAQGNVVIPGGTSQFPTTVASAAVKLAPDTGQEVARLPAVPGSDDGTAYAAALDAQGNLILTGSSPGSAGAMPGATGVSDMKTVKYARGTNAPMWSTDFAADANRLALSNRGERVLPFGDDLYVVGVAVTAQELTQGVSIVKYGATLAQSTPTYQGLWWGAPAGIESGWGVNITHQGDILFAVWFTYDVDGTPMWLVMPRGEKADAHTYSGPLYRTTGPSFSASPWDPSKVTATAVGTATFAFTDVDNGTFTYAVSGQTQSKAITRQIWGQAVHRCATYIDDAGFPDPTDLWWAAYGKESGWGLNLVHQDDTIFATLFTYDAGGRATWYVASNVRPESSGSNKYIGSVYSTRGPAYNAVPWNPSKVSVTQAGNLTLLFNFDYSATSTLQIGLDTVTKTLMREPYALPASDCR